MELSDDLLHASKRIERHKQAKNIAASEERWIYEDEDQWWMNILMVFPIHSHHFSFSLSRLRYLSVRKWMNLFCHHRKVKERAIKVYFSKDFISPGDSLLGLWLRIGISISFPQLIRLSTCPQAIECESKICMWLLCKQRFYSNCSRKDGYCLTSITFTFWSKYSSYNSQTWIYIDSW